VHNFGGILGARICLGIVEAGFVRKLYLGLHCRMLIEPLVPLSHFYLTLFYTRHEIAKRISFFYMMGFVANAFSGLIAYSVFQWHHSLYVVLLSPKVVELETDNHRIGNISSLLKAA
jgi:hypothetical protein